MLREVMPVSREEWSRAYVAGRTAYAYEAVAAAIAEVNKLEAERDVLETEAATILLRYERTPSGAIILAPAYPPELVALAAVMVDAAKPLMHVAATPEEVYPVSAWEALARSLRVHVAWLTSTLAAVPAEVRAGVA